MPAAHGFSYSLELDEARGPSSCTLCARSQSPLNVHHLAVLFLAIYSLLTKYGNLTPCLLERHLNTRRPVEYSGHLFFLFQSDAMMQSSQQAIYRKNLGFVSRKQKNIYTTNLRLRLQALPIGPS